MIEEAYAVLHVKCPLLLTDFNKCLAVSSDFSKILQCPICDENFRSFYVVTLPNDQWIDMAKLIGAVLQLSVAIGSQNTTSIITVTPSLRGGVRNTPLGMSFTTE
jgi:ABC-type sulfate transport system permease subunit